MSKEIAIPHGVSGLTTLYAAIRRPGDGQRWYTVTPAFEPYNAAHVAAGYAIALAEEGTTGNYFADFPAGIAAAGRYEVVARNQAGGSPAWPADPVVGLGEVCWSGSAVIVPAVAMAYGQVVAGSTGSSVVVSGLPAGKSYVGQHLYQYSSGEARTIASQSAASGNYTFPFAGSAGTATAPFAAVAAGEIVSPAP